MGVAEITWTRNAIERAISRSRAVKLAQYAYGPELPDTHRQPKTSGKGVGHTYIHVEGTGAADHLGRGSGLQKKSRFADFDTMVTCIVQVMRLPPVKDALGRLDANPGNDHQEWLHHLPVTGEVKGYRQHGTTLEKIKDISINMRSHGDALFISSCYPEAFHTTAAPGAGSA